MLIYWKNNIALKLSVMCPTDQVYTIISFDSRPIETSNSYYSCVTRKISMAQFHRSLDLTFVSHENCMIEFIPKTCMTKEQVFVNIFFSRTKPEIQLYVFIIRIRGKKNNFVSPI